MFFLSPRMGRLSMQYGPRLFMALGPILAGVAVLAYTRLPQDVDYWVDIVPALLVFAVGLSMTVAPLTTTVLADAGPGDAGVASGVNNAVARIAGLLAIAILGILAAGGGDHLTVHGFHLTMGAVAALLVCGGLIGAIGIRNPASPRHCICKIAPWPSGRTRRPRRRGSSGSASTRCAAGIARDGSAPSATARTAGSSPLEEIERLRGDAAPST